MHESSKSVAGPSAAPISSILEANSLFRNILRVNYFASIFYPDQPHIFEPQLNENKDLIG
jgi:hypothetical protein